VNKDILEAIEVLIQNGIDASSVISANSEEEAIVLVHKMFGDFPMADDVSLRLCRRYTDIQRERLKMRMVEQFYRPD
jgi:hypothetical protein